MKFKNFIKDKFLSKICILLVALILIIVFLNPFSIFDSFSKNLIYVVIFLFLMSFLSLFFNRTLDIYLTIILVTTLIFIYAAEFYLVYKSFNYIKKYENISNKKGNSDIIFDNRSKFKIYRDLKKENPNIAIAVPPLSYLFSGNVNKKLNFFPLSGISNSQTIHCNESGYYSIYQSDRYGFNNPDNEWDKKKIDLVLLGDSFVHGACVNRPNDVASNLRDNFNLNVINLGYSSNGPLIEYATLKEYFNLNFENIVWVFFEGNDILDFQFERKNLMLNRYLEDSDFNQNLKNKQNKIDILNKEVIKNEIKFYLKKFIKLGNLRELFQNPNFKKIDNTANIINSKNDNHIDDFVEIILKAREFSKKNNLNFYFVYLPATTRILWDGDTNRILDGNYDNNIYLKVKSKLENNGINFIDLKTAMYEGNDRLLEYFPLRQINHFNEKGYDRMAKEIYKFIYEK